MDGDLERQIEGFHPVLKFRTVEPDISDDLMKVAEFSSRSQIPVSGAP